MNKIFKLIWNKSLGQMVVVSENAKSVGKKESSTGSVVSTETLNLDTNKSRILGLQTLVLSIATIMGTDAWAGNIVQGVSCTSGNAPSITLTTDNQVSYGTGSGLWPQSALNVFTGDNAVIIGGDCNHLTWGLNNAVAIGGAAASINGVAIGTEALAYQQNSIALGYQAKAMGKNSIALGANSIADRANSFSVGSTTTQRQIINVATPTQATDAANKGYVDTAIAAIPTAVASDNYARSSTDTALGAASSIAYNAQSNGTQLTSVGGITVTATTTNIDDITSFTLPDGTVVTDVNQVAAFKNAAKKGANIAIGGYSSSIGFSNIASGFLSNAIGSSNKASGKYSSAIGDGNTATGEASNAIGRFNLAEANGSSALGYWNTASGESSNAVGNSNIASGESASAVGDSNRAQGKQSSAFGSDNTTNGEASSAIGDYNRAMANLSSAIGSNNIALADSSSAVGRSNTASGDSSSAFGNSNTALGSSSNAIGSSNTANGMFSNAIGSQNTVNGVFSTGIGFNNNVTQGESVGLGISNTVSGKWSNAVGSYNKATGTASFAAGSQNLAKGSGSTVLGAASGMYYDPQDDSTKLTAINGIQVQATDLTTSSITQIGDVSVTSDQALDFERTLRNGGSIAFGDRSAAIGSHNIALGGQSAAVGYDNQALGVNSTSLGTLNKATGGVSTAVGSNNTASAIYSSVFGSSSQATAYGSTAIGHDSLADEANTISVGRSGAEKRITNVATPTQATDAANKGYVDTGLAAKTDKTVFDTLNSKVNDATTGLDTKASMNALTTGLSNTLTDAKSYADQKDLVLDGKITTNANEIAALQTGLGNISTNAVVYDNAAKETITLAGQSGTKLTNLQAGDISSSSSKDAVTGGQLYTTNQNINTLSTQFNSSANQLASVLGGGAGFNNGVFTLPTFTIQGTNYSNIGATFGAVNNELTALKGSVSNLKNYVDQQDAKTLSDANTYTDTQSSGTLANAKSYIDQQDAKNLNDAKSYTDQQTSQSLNDSKSYTDQQTTTALNDAKTYTDQQAASTLNNAQSYTDQKVAEAGQYISIGGNGTGASTSSNATGKNSTAIGPNTVVTGNNSTAVGVSNTVSGNGSGAFGDPNTVSGNGSYVVGNDNTVKGDNTFVLGNNVTTEAKNAVVLGNGSTSDRDNTVSVGSSTNQRQVTHVAAGTADTDAVNVAQMNKSSSETLSSANSYTDTRFAGLESTFKDYSLQTERRFQEVDKRFDRQGAMSAAMMNMATSTAGLRGQNRIEVGAGLQGAEQAVAVGYQRMINENTSLSISGALSKEESSGGVGVGFSW
ncbi:ESPR-type extended signal peptide-containing protein [Acinetobacter ursingii]|uniref:ESPR-type extended signal peptide-containing protein n=1 Tax=Acinetobacter ursingii TaxID=108980 RepID=UPI0021D3E548|nr:ESPR-type extended signal peptide-containing protein [Acinetobacter ursingii]MCU4357172.1 YadA-like family protein [Acinetobacter ursingii]